MNRDELRRLVIEEVVRSLRESEAPASNPHASPAPAPKAHGVGEPRATGAFARSSRGEGARPKTPTKAPEFPPPKDDPTPRWLRGPRGVRVTSSDDDDGSAAWGLRDLPPHPDEATLHVPRPRDGELLRDYARATPSQVGVWRTGTRYLTERYVEMRAEHAVAKDAVTSELPEGFAASLGALELRTQCKDRDEYLLHPELGRRLTDESAARLSADGSRGADVQVIIGDGLSAWAALGSAPALVPALDAGLRGAGFSTGRPVVVRFARVGVQDHVGVTLGSRATVILVGERPGLGTGDSLSIYVAWGPKLGQDNAEKNCISNVRPRGIQTDEAVRQTVAILKRAAELGRGGVAAQ